METLRLKRKQKCVPCHTELSSVWWGVEGRRKILDSWHRKNSSGEEPSSFVKGGAVAPLGRWEHGRLQGQCEGSPWVGLKK